MPSRFQPFFSNVLQLPPAGNSEFIPALLRDLVSSNPQEGQVAMTGLSCSHALSITAMSQVTLGLSDHQFKSKWGDHYTRSLLCAHRLQQCHNYKVFVTRHVFYHLFSPLIFFVGPIRSTLRRSSVQVPHPLLSNLFASHHHSPTHQMQDHRRRR